MVGKDIEHPSEVLIMDGQCRTMYHYVIQVDDYSWNASEDGGHDFLKAAGGGAEAKRHAGVTKKPQRGTKKL